VSLQWRSAATFLPDKTSPLFLFKKFEIISDDFYKYFGHLRRRAVIPALNARNNHHRILARGSEAIRCDRRHTEYSRL
jgi:hypothetical protein